MTLKNSLFEKDLESLKHELSHKGLNNEQLSDKLRNLQLLLTFLTSSDSTSVISPLEETIFRNTLRKKQAQSTDGIQYMKPKMRKGGQFYYEKSKGSRCPVTRHQIAHSEKGAKTLSI